MPLEFQTALSPHAFGIPIQETPPSPSEFQDAARGMVWIFSGITHFSSIYVNLNNDKNKAKLQTTIIEFFGLQTESEVHVPLMMEEISCQSQQQRHAWIQHATATL